MAYEDGYEGGYEDGGGPPPPVEFCVAVGWGSGPYAVMAYGGSEICDLEIEDEVIVEPRSNIRELCIVRCN